VLTVLELSGGGRIDGELLAVYDHSRWWSQPGPELTYGLFRPLLFAPYPNDRSMAFVSSTDVRTADTEPWPEGRIRYRDFLHSAGLVLAAVPLDGPTLVLMGHDGWHLEENGYGRFAWDLTHADEHGARHRGDGADNADWLVWDAPVRLPLAGTVVDVARDHPDNPPGTYEDDAPNNLVGVHLQGSYYLYLLHFRQGSVPEDVEGGGWLPAGTEVGRVGNSGVSLEPHLHMTLLWYDDSAEPLRSWSVPTEMAGIWAAPGPRGPWRLHAHLTPETGTWLANERPPEE